MKKKLCLFNNSGFTLMEVMISSGLLSVLVLASMHFVGNQSKDQANLNKMLKIVEWIQITNKIMSDPRGCRATMTAKNHFTVPAGQAIERLYYSDKAKSEIFYIDATRRSVEDGAEITGMTLQNPQDILTVGPYKFTKLELNIGYTYKVGTDVASIQTSNLVFPFIAKVDAVTNQIIDCKKTVEPAEVLSNTCDALGGNALDSVQDCDITSLAGLDATDNLNVLEHLENGLTPLSNDMKLKLCIMVETLCASDVQYAHLCPYGGCTNLGCGSTHLISDCGTAGGTVILAGTEYICRFNSGTCPGGWSQCSNWSRTVDNTCNDPDGGCSGSPPDCTAYGHSWSNTAPDQCNYYDQELTSTPGCPPDGKGGYISCCDPSMLGSPISPACRATINQIGCR